MERLHYCAQHALVLVDRGGGLGIADLGGGSPENCGDVTAAVCGIAVCRFIEVDNEDAVASGCECRGLGPGGNYVRLQPGVRLLRRSIVRVVVDIWNDVGEVR